MTSSSREIVFAERALTSSITSTSTYMHNRMGEGNGGVVWWVQRDLGMRCGIVWCSMVWCSMVWCGVVWCSVVL